MLCRVAPYVNLSTLSPESVIVHCVSIASDACDAVRSWVLLPMWANSLSVHIEENVTDDQAPVSLALTTMQAYCRAAPMQHHGTLTWLVLSTYRSISPVKSNISATYIQQGYRVHCRNKPCLLRMDHGYIWVSAQVAFLEVKVWGK